MGETSTTRSHIIHAAFDSFLEVGYARTTYQRVAHLTGHERTLVQYHVPRKDLLARKFLTALLAAAERYLAATVAVSRDEPVAYRFALAQVYFGCLSSDTLHRFTLDVLDQRSIISHTLADEVDWNLALVQPAEAERQDVIDDTVVAVGGAYELLAFRLRSGREPRPTDLARRGLDSALSAELKKRGSTPELISAVEFSADELDRAVAAVLQDLRDHRYAV